MESFVPDNLGYLHITREQALQKQLSMPGRVLGENADRLALVPDCTYIYIEKPGDFVLQRKTFSLHKTRNLLKFLIECTTNGYMIDVSGPYFCDASNNDATIMKHHYTHSDILLFMEEEDFFLKDRGFRDAVQETTANGLTDYMPSLCGRNQVQFTAEEANSSRGVLHYIKCTPSPNCMVHI
jgi:hypothetical protein